MKRADRLAIAAAVLALVGACPGKGGPTTGGGGGSGEVGGARLCEEIRPKVERLYRAEAEAKEPKRVDEAVADNTTMVMNDCAKAPTRVAECVNRVSSVAELEKRCLVPLDDEGTEGEELSR
jgi:hypothetical protein